MGGLFGKKTQSTTPTRLNGISINQSVYGNCVPLQYGTGRLPLTLIDYVDFQAIPHSQSTGGKGGGGGGSPSSYTYTASIIGLLCEGIIKGIPTVYSDKTQTTMAALHLTSFAGVGLQPPWIYMTQLHPERALPYDHMAYVAGANFDLGSSAGLPNLSFEVQGMFLFGATMDAEPADILLDYCTEPNHGIGFNYLTNLKGTNSYSTYCIAMDFLISPQETTQRQAQDFIKETLQVTNSNAVFTPGVGLRIVPYADQAVTGNGVTYTPNLSPQYSFTDTDYLYDAGQPPIQWTSTKPKETFNIWTVEYLDRSNQYNVGTETFTDEQDVAVNGKRAAPSVSLHSITRASVALRVATHLCLRNLYVRRQAVLKVRADFSLLEPMDYIAVTDSATGDVNKLMRAIKTEDAIDPDRGEVFTITAEEVLVGPASAPVYDTELAQGYAANYGADPGNVVKPYIFTAPPALTSAASGGYEEWIAVTGASGLWGGADIWASLDNQTYSHVGIKTNPSRYGTLLTTLPASAGDPDTSNTLILNFAGSLPITLDSATRSAADALRMMLIVDGEIMAFQNVTPMGNNQFSVSYLRRGLYGSTNAQHLAGSQFAVLDDAIWRMKFDAGDSGQPVWYKFVGFNYWGGGEQDISQVTAYQAFFQGQNHGQLLAPGATPLVARGACVNVGSQIYKRPTGIAFRWDSGCYSINPFAAACTVRFRAMQTNAQLMVGFNTDPLTFQTYGNLAYSWRIETDGNAYTYEDGVLIAFARPYTTNDIFEIRYDGKFVTYLISGVQYRTTATSGRVFYFDSLFNTPGGSVDDVYFGALNPANSSPFMPRGQCRVSDESVIKSGGTNAWDSDVYSLEGYSNCHVSFKANDTTHQFVIGLGTKPAQDSSYTSVDYSWNPTESGLAYIYEGATQRVANIPYDATTVFAITCDGSTVTWLKNGVSQRTVAAPGLSLFMDSSFYHPGGGVNTLQFGPTTQLQLADTSQIGVNAASQILSAYFIGAFPFTVTSFAFTTAAPASNASTNISGAISTHGGPVAVDVMVGQVDIDIVSAVTGFNITLTLLRNGVAVATAPTPGYSTTSMPWLSKTTGAENLVTCSFTCVDNPPAGGPYTYSLAGTGSCTGASGSISVSFNATSLKLREILR